MLTKALVLGGALFAMSFGAAQAGEYTIEVRPDNRDCFLVNYIPATYLVNTRGKLVSKDRRVWEGDIAEGAIVVHRRVPATYIESRRLIESDHYSLSPTSCR